MIQVVRAIYQGGQLRLLEPVELPEGQPVRVTIERLNEREALRAALGDSVHWPDPTDDTDAEIEAEAAAIEEAFKGSRPLSEIIIEKRGER
jgi:predicted DNA-binding antitoxin AbrB/MazE fold protein